MAKALWKARILVAALMALAACTAFAQGGPQGREVVSMLTQGGMSEPAVSIRMTEPGMVALAEWVDSGTVPSAAKKGAKDQALVETLQPFAKVRIFLARGKKKAWDQSKKVTFEEVADFTLLESKSEFIVEFALEPGKTVWFQDPAHPVDWYSMDELEEGPAHGYEIGAVEYDTEGTHLRASILKWPEGDPTMGWGPRRK
jgi:hypothetical protein